jgi:hypothetical protein
MFDGKSRRLILVWSQKTLKIWEEVIGMPRGDGTGPSWGRGPWTGRGAEWEGLEEKGRGDQREGGTKAGSGTDVECMCQNAE